MTTVPDAPLLGRPRDPRVDERVTTAAVELFGDLGWSGFSIEVVARRAGVGKASIYLRWPTKQALLTSALEANLAVVADIDTGSTRSDLIALTRHMLGLYLSRAGRAAMRLALDGHPVPEIRQFYEALKRDQIRAARHIVHRGVERGDLAPSTSVTLVLDTLAGGAMMHASSAPPELRERIAAGADAYAERLVDFVLGSAAREGSP